MWLHIIEAAALAIAAGAVTGGLTYFGLGIVEPETKTSTDQRNNAQ